MSAMKELTDGWSEGYKRVHGFKYVFQPKDGVAANRLLKMQIPVPEILSVAEEAWLHPDWFNCKHAASLPGFACRFYDIRCELKHPPTNGAQKLLQRDELNRVMASMKNISYSYSENLSWKKEDVERYKKLRQRRDELKQKLGVMV